MGIFDDLESLRPNSQTAAADSTPYIFPNESNQSETLKKVQDMLGNDGLDKQRVHVGFSVWFNLDLLGAYQAEYGIILDANTKVHRVFDKIQEAISESSSPQAFAELFSKLILENKLTDFPESWFRGYLGDELTKEGGFLQNQISFDRVRDMFVNGKLFFGEVSLVEDSNIATISKWRRKNNLEVSTLYIGNIAELFEYCSFEDQKDMLSNLAKLKSRDTYVIDAFNARASKDASDPPLRISHGLPNFKKQKERKSQDTFFQPPSLPEPSEAQPVNTRKKSLG